MRAFARQVPCDQQHTVAGGRGRAPRLMAGRSTEGAERGPDVEYYMHITNPTPHHPARCRLRRSLSRAGSPRRHYLPTTLDSSVRARRMRGASRRGGEAYSPTYL